MDVADSTAWCMFTDYTEGEMQGDEEGILTSCRDTSHMTVIPCAVLYIGQLQLYLYINYYNFPYLIQTTHSVGRLILQDKVW